MDTTMHTMDTTDIILYELIHYLVVTLQPEYPSAGYTEHNDHSAAAVCTTTEHLQHQLRHVPHRQPLRDAVVAAAFALPVAPYDSQGSLGILGGSTEGLVICPLCRLLCLQ